MKEKDPAAVALGKKGGPKRWEGISPEARTKHAKAAAKARWHPNGTKAK